MGGAVTVVGSLNHDIAVSLERLPTAGETVAGGPVRRGVGGKGANQAVALARLGRRTRMVGAVGADAEGAALRAALAAEGVDVADVATVEGPSGTAIVLVHGGESTIVVSAGANERLDAARVRAAAGPIAQAAAVLVQCEVPDSALVAAAELASGLYVVNPAPARRLPQAVLSRADVLVPNLGELSVLTGAAVPDDPDDIVDLARALRPAAATVVTCGGDGAVVVEPTGVVRIPAVPTTLVDATAAGDSFVAAVTDALLDGASLADAARWASRVAAVTVSRPGASASLPRRAEIPA
ncbi:ribokinase [Pseudonocardia hispaniensis]|uniref:Ribokinase n=1 Tax=Pseudonocardia hispaniensis TaxID=904933 RepID=A0ABW1IY20_9PSEU